MRILFLLFLFSFKLASAQQADTISLYDSNNEFVQYLIGDAVHKEVALHAALSKAYSDSLTYFEKQALLTNYHTLGYDTSAIKFGTATGTSSNNNTGDLKSNVYAFIVLNHTTKVFTFLFEDVSYFNLSHKLIEEVIPVPFIDLIFQRTTQNGLSLKEIYINSIYLRDWQGRIIRLQNINLSKRLQ